LKVIDLQNAVDATWALQHFSILPTDSTVLLNANIENINNVPAAKYIFIDGSYDPVLGTDDDILELISAVQQQHPQSRVVFLSSKCSHYYTESVDILWYPVFMLRKYNRVTGPRSRRVSCLNRRNAPHRVWLMHNLISQGLIDHRRDVFSVAFRNIYDGQICDLSIWNPELAQHNRIIAQYPDRIATFDDGFVNDHTIDHPAWRTAISIVTETEVGALSFITEKTVKAIESESCWIVHTGQFQLNVMIDLGFELGMFEKHATKFDIDPILTVCRTLDTESAALDYYNSRLPLIQHNREWLESGWRQRYMKKLHAVLN
jgi:hypothetical protein